MFIFKQKVEYGLNSIENQKMQTVYSLSQKK